MVAGFIIKWNDNLIDVRGKGSYLLALLGAVFLFLGVYLLGVGDIAWGIVLGLVIAGKIDDPRHVILIIPLLFLLGGQLPIILGFTIASFLDEQEVLDRWFSRLLALLLFPYNPTYLLGILAFDVAYNAADWLWRGLYDRGEEHKPSH